MFSNFVRHYEVPGQRGSAHQVFEVRGASLPQVYNCFNTNVGDQCQNVVEPLGGPLWVVAVGVAIK